MSKLPISYLKGLSVSCFAAADQGIGTLKFYVRTSMFFAADLHLASPQLPLGMQQICGPIFFETIFMPF